MSKKKQLRCNEERQRFTVWIPARLKQMVKEQAQYTNKSYSKLMTELLESYYLK